LLSKAYLARCPDHVSATEAYTFLLDANRPAPKVPNGLPVRDGVSSRCDDHGDRQEPAARGRPVTRWWREPTVHFFLLGALLFLVHRLVAGDPRTVVVSPGLRAELVRRFRDQAGRTPDPAELERSLRDWKRDEALFREALRERLDRDDPSIRNILIGNIRARMALEAPKHDPSDAELDQWLATHRSLYERPFRYTLEWVAFPKGAGSAPTEREKFRHATETGADPRFLGKPIFGATLTGDEVREKLGAAVFEALEGFPRASWQPAENTSDFLLVRVDDVEGGLPKPDELRPRLMADLANAERERSVERAVQAVVARYRFEEQQ
jgi:hypothetical protein